MPRAIRHAIAIAAAAAALATAPLAAQDRRQGPELDAEELAELDRAAEEMIARVYVYETPTAWIRPSEMAAKLRDMGYRRLHDFDVDHDRYEVEAMLPGTDEEVELDIDPITGRIMDVERNWF